MISASSNSNHYCAKSLNIFEENPILLQNFGNLSNYESIIIMDDESHNVWCHQMIVHLYQKRHTPIMLIEAIEFWVSLNNNFFDSQNDQFFEYVAKFIQNYVKVSKYSKYQLTKNTSRLKTSEICNVTIVKAHKSFVLWWTLSPHQK